jgi:endonuclease/exonuclease/phosphatase family metal-dependent hydrolase
MRLAALPTAHTALRSTLLLLALVLAIRTALPAATEESSPEPPAALRMRVVSYNTWLLPYVSKAYTERRARFAGALAGLQADVLCLQEVWTGSDQGLLQESLKKTLPHAHRAVGGLLLLSRFEIESAVFTRFPPDPELPLRERIAGKGYLDARIKTPLGPVRIVTCHLAALPHAGSPRSRQLEHLLTHLAKDTNVPLLLAGDLNMPTLREGRPTRDWLRLAESDLLDLNPATPAAKGTWADGAFTWFSWPRDEARGHRRDYVCIRQTAGIQIRRVAFRQALDTAQSALSDHNAQVADLEFTRAEGSDEGPAGR